MEMMWLLYGACLGAACFAAWDLVRARRLTWGFVVPEVRPMAEPARFERVFDSTDHPFPHIDQDEGCRHAAAFAGAGLCWFEGTREAAEDVCIRQLNLETGEISDWFDTKELTKAVRPRQVVRVLGNTIGTPDGGFLTTSVSFGGWAGSSLTLGHRDAAGRLQARRLHTHAYFNRSHLVRSPIVPLIGGDMLVPAYFEVSLCVGEMIRLRPDGTAVWKARIGSGRHLIQPHVHVLDTERAFALARSMDGSKRLYRSETEDGGKTWSRPTLTDLPCPDAPIALAPLSGGRILMAHNPDGKHTKSLRLSLSADEGHSWQTVHEFQSGVGDVPEGGIRYPALEADGKGGLRLAFTAKNKRAIFVYAFNEAWVEAQL